VVRLVATRVANRNFGLCTSSFLSPRCCTVVTDPLNIYETKLYVRCCTVVILG
jgi:hypothetical protein